MCVYHSELKVIKRAGHTDLQCFDAAINEMETYYMESSGCARYDETNEAKIQSHSHSCIHTRYPKLKFLARTIAVLGVSSRISPFCK